MERVLVFAVAIALCAAAHAGDTGAPADGIGTGIVFPVAPQADARVGYPLPKWTYDLDTFNFFRKLDAQLFRFSDFQPLGPTFRLTADNRFEAIGRPNIGTGNLIAKVDAGSRAIPYVGLGSGNAAGWGPNFYADVGVMLTGSASTPLTLDCTWLSLGQCLALRNQSVIEQQTAFRASPAMNFGVRFGF